MPSSILNSDDGVISGTSGLKSSGGDDGVLNIQNNGTTAVTVNASGRVGIGTTSPSQLLNVVGGTILQQRDSNSVSIIQSVGASFNRIWQRRSAGTNASPTIVASGDAVGDILWSGYDGVGYIPAASIQAAIDGTPGTDDMPGRLVFFTTADGGNTVTERMRLDSSGNLRFNSGYGSVATAYGCRAWVGFNGTGTPAIIGSGNVSSITDNGTGDFTINFTTALSDANYATTGMSSDTPTINTVMAVYNGFTTTTAVRVQTFVANTVSPVDRAYNSVLIHR
jgi:hypothetical protein